MDEQQQAEQGGRATAYVGVGCFTALAGWAGGAMIAVMLAKIVGWITKCQAGERGEPCNWFTFAVFGALTGAILLPTIAIWKLRRGSVADAAAGPPGRNEL
jgi:hypothetical protein